MTVNRVLTDLDFSTDFKVRDQALAALARRIKAAAVSTRQSLASFAVTADPHQDAVVRSPARTIRMVAPAGAGKTQTIINRVLHRVQQGLNPARALLLTFDKAAVYSIKLMSRPRAECAGGVRIVVVRSGEAVARSGQTHLEQLRSWAKVHRSRPPKQQNAIRWSLSGKTT